MDYLYGLDQMNYYNIDYNNMGFFDLNPFGYINDISNRNRVYMRDKIMPETFNKKKKRTPSDIGVNINNKYGFFNNNNFNRNPNKINNNYMNKKGMPNLNKNFFRTDKNFYRNFDNHNPTESANPSQYEVQNIPLKYYKMYPDQIEQNNNNVINRNKNMFNQKNNRENNKLKKNPNINNNVNNKASSLNNKNIKHTFYHIKNYSQNNQFQRKINENNLNMPPHINMHNKIIVNNNINNNLKYPLDENLRNSEEMPYNKLNKFVEHLNSTNKKENKIKKNLNPKKNIAQERKKKIEKPNENDEDESLSNLAEDLFNACVKKNNKKIKPGSKKNEKLLKVNNNEIKNNEYNIVFNNSIQLNEIKSSAEFGCQAETSDNNNNKNIQENNNLEKINNNKQEEEKGNKKENKKPEAIDEGIGIQQSLLPFLQMELSNNTPININADLFNEKNRNLNNDKEIENKKENENKLDKGKLTFKNLDLNNINTINENNNNESEKGNNNQNDENDLTNSKNSIVRQEEISYEADKENRIDDDFHLGENIIESDEENIKAKRITIEENKNIYFNFLKDGLINDCQVRKGKFGDLQCYTPKKENDIFDSRIIFNYKSCIKKFNKDEIKLDKDYKLRENMNEREILPDDFFEGEENVELDDNLINELADSLRGSIDKSTNSEVNESLRKSINHSYNQSIRNSLMTSNNNEGQGILKRLKLAFEESLNQEIN